MENIIFYKKTGMYKCLLLLFSLAIPVAHLNSQFQRIVGPTSLNWTLFGESVSMHGPYAVVGEPARDANGLVPEKVHLYKRKLTGWERIQTILSSNIALETDMGGRTALSDNWLVFSQISGTSSFKYFIYQRQADTFIYKQTLAHPEPWDHQFVCKTIALTDNHLIVGGRGSAFCYRVNPTTGLWQLNQTITKTGTEFGGSVAVYNDRAVICSILEDAAYVYEFVNDSWIERKKIVPANNGNHQFGANCTIYKDLIAVTDFGGSYNTNQDTSKAYIYKWGSSNEIKQIAALKSPNNFNYSNFGGAFYFNDDFLFIGSNTDFNNGKVFKYRRMGDHFLFQTQFKSPDNTNGSTFGESLAGYGNQLLVGDPTYGILRGAVYQGFVYDSLYLVSDCMLPVPVNGNMVTVENFQDVFESDATSVSLGKPRKFGAIDAEKLFGNMEEIQICDNADGLPPIEIDYNQGLKILIPDGLYARWKGSFTADGKLYSASDILDDTTSLKPKIVKVLPAGKIQLFLEFGIQGQEPCMSFPLNLTLVQIRCQNTIDTIEMVAGDTITLNSNCTSGMPLNVWSHNWSAPASHDKTFVTTYKPDTRIFPLSSALYTYQRLYYHLGFVCEGTQNFYVSVTATDEDGDGFYYYEDCDDTNPLVNPSALEVPFNGLDDDCQDGDDGFCLQRIPGPEKGMDAMVQSNKATINEGRNDDLNVAYDGELSPLKKHQSFIKFDLTTVPKNAVIDSAFLSLFWNPTDSHGVFGNGHFDGVNGSAPSQLVMDRVTKFWDEKNINWNNQPTISATNRVVVSHATYPGGTSNFKNMNVTKLFRDMLDSSQTNFGLRLFILPQSGVRQLIFASSNHPNPNLRPKLKLCWHNDQINGITEVSEKDQIQIHPNPAFDQVKIYFTGIQTQKGVMINSIGQVVKRFPVTQGDNVISILDLPTGPYFLRIEDGICRTFIKQ